MTGRPAFEHRPEKRGLIGPFSGRQLGSVVLVIVVAAVLLVAVTTPLGSTDVAAQVNPQATAYLVGTPTVGLRPGSLAPELAGIRSEGTSWQQLDVNGKPVRLADHRGHGVWINFWASWCAPCQAETPVLRDIDQQYRSQGLDIIGISVKETTSVDVGAYARSYNLTYTIAADLTGDVFNLYGVYALPTQVFIDPNGIVRAVVNGPLTAAQAATYVAQILPPAGASASPGSPQPVSLGAGPP
ncbi:MAG TPA: TlpA disulfide reductase family protein [Candidatus Limnocylindrales bacterium]|nr:TlpA disulfide reductase family protein [Candidatus Limnocylindrales bacterium]